MYESETTRTIYKCRSCKDVHDDMEGFQQSWGIRGGWTEGAFTYTCPETGERIMTEFTDNDY